MVVSYGFWRSHLGANAAAVGSRLQVNGVDCEIVGVTPRGFAGFVPDNPPGLWLPLMLQARLHYNHNETNGDPADPSQPWAPQRGISWLQVLARVPQPAMLGAVVSQLSRIVGDDARQDDPHSQWRVVATAAARGLSHLARDFAQPLWILLAMVGMMLLIGCANVATLLLARSVARQREIAVRLSLGVSRARLARQLLTEGILLGSLAGVAALALARSGGAALGRLAVNIPQDVAPTVAVDARVLIFVAVAALLVGVLVSLLPAWQAGRMEVAAVLKSERTHAGRLPFGRALVVGQVALALLLVTGAVLFSRSLARLAQLDPGFDRLHVLNLHLDPRAAGIPIAELPLLYRRVERAVGAVPSVRSVAFSQCALPSGCMSAADIYLGPGSKATVGSEDYSVSPDYFATAGIPLLRGRGFEARDVPHAAEVALVNQAFADKYFRHGNVLGQRFGWDAKNPAEFTIVGVVGNARLHNLREDAQPQLFVSLDQQPEYISSLQVRTAGDPMTVAATVQRAIAAVAPSLPAYQASTTGELVQISLSDELMLARLSAMFGALALGLACLGLYGVIAYLVARRTPEFGLRMALGAPRASLLALVLREAVLLMATGLALGLPLARLAGRLLQHQLSNLLWGVTAVDPLCLAIAAALLLALPGVAALIPAERATRVDPLQALRAE